MALLYVIYFRFCVRRHIFIQMRQRAESSTTLCLEEVRQVAVPLLDVKTTVFGRVHQNAAPRALSVIVETVYNTEQGCSR